MKRRRHAKGVGPASDGKPLDPHNSRVDKLEVMTVQQVADYLGCGTATVIRLAKGGKLPTFRLGERWRFLRSEIRKWIVQQTVKP